MSPNILKLIIVTNNEDTIKLNPPRFNLKERVVWILMACLGRDIILVILEVLTQ